MEQILKDHNGRTFQLLSDGKTVWVNADDGVNYPHLKEGASHDRRRQH
ncbi:hypothetical protein [Pseudosulfitobacter pseudonitzschiae]